LVELYDGHPKHLVKILTSYRIVHQNLTSNDLESNPATAVRYWRLNVWAMTLLLTV